MLTTEDAERSKEDQRVTGRAVLERIDLAVEVALDSAAVPGVGLGGQVRRSPAPAAAVG